MTLLYSEIKCKIPRPEEFDGDNGQNVVTVAANWRRRGTPSTRHAAVKMYFEARLRRSENVSVDQAEIHHSFPLAVVCRRPKL